MCIGTDCGLSLFFSLEENKLVIIFVAHNSVYTDNMRECCSLPNTVFKIIGMMKLKQKVLIHEEDAEKKGGDRHEKVKI